MLFRSSCIQKVFQNWTIWSSDNFKPFCNCIDLVLRPQLNWWACKFLLNIKKKINFENLLGSGNGNVGSSLGSHYASANSGCSSDRGSGGKRSLNSGSSIESNREFSSLTKQMNLFLRTKSDSGKRLSDEVKKLNSKFNLYWFLIRFGRCKYSGDLKSGLVCYAGWT